MSQLLIRFCDIFLSGIVIGILVGIWIGYNPHALSAPTYVEQQQGAIKALNTLMPILGLITIMLTLASAFMQRGDNAVLTSLLLAAGLFIVCGLITRLGNQPINSIVMTWDKAAIPSNWTELRDKWWTLHIARALAALGGFCLILWAGIKKV
jgi:hypothetical protein